MIVKGMIFAAGFGSRLGELGQSVPKCLLEVTPGKHLIDFILDRYASVGITDVVVNTHHLADKVKTYLASYSGPLKLHVVYEPEVLETGGGLLGASSFLSDADHVVLQNGDIYSECSLPAMLKLHCEGGQLATLLTQNRGSSRGFYFDDNGALVGHLSESKGVPVKKFVSFWDQTESNLRSFGGVSVISRDFFDVLSKFSGKFSITGPFWAAAENRGAVRSFDDSLSRWADVGTVEKLEKLKAQLRTGNF
jgi:NDP-sugar pyrophosphorylase family protein